MSTGYKLLDYVDIQNAILEELKVPTTDGVTLARIKRDINIIYLNHVIPFKPRAWEWLEYKQDIPTVVKQITGTVSIAADSDTLTFSDAQAVDLDNYYIKLDGFPDIMKISAHTAASTSATISSAWVNDTATDVGFKAWKDYASLSTNIKNVVIVSHDRRSTPLDAVHGAKFTEMRARYPEYEGYPTIYSMGDFDSDGNRTIKWYPACWEDRLYLHIEGRQEATALSADADEPLMPVEDRIVLFYGACSRAWARERNESEATKNWNLFMQKLAEMAGKSGDAPQVTEMKVDPDYTVRKRYKRRMRRGYGNFESE